MADDMDDLLNCIEKKMTLKGKGSDSDDEGDIAVSRRTCTNHMSQDNCHRKRDPLDLSDILDDDDDDDYIKPRAANKPRSTRDAADTGSAAVVSSLSASVNIPLNMKKCFPVYVGGSHCSKGLSTSVNKRACDKLRCTDCDFTVSSFDDLHWASNIDYLFLRNNMPDYDRLKSKLKSKKGSRAYACQCRWYSADGLTELSCTGVKWVCGKH